MLQNPRALISCNEIGFAYVALDLKGYRTGSMNETLKDAIGQK